MTDMNHNDNKQSAATTVAKTIATTVVKAIATTVVKACAMFITFIFNSNTWLNKS